MQDRTPEIREFSFYRLKLYNDGGLHTWKKSKGQTRRRNSSAPPDQPLILTSASADAKDSFSVTAEPSFYTKLK